MIYVKTIRALAALLLSLSAAAQAQDGPQPRLDTVDITAGMHVIKAEVARSQQQQMMGMMFRKDMGPNEGMLFANDDRAPRCFWMRNTLIPLSIAFIDDDGSIVNIADMQPQSDASHCSAKPVRFALEMNQGWFAERALKPGTKLKGVPFGSGR